MPHAPPTDHAFADVVGPAFALADGAVAATRTAIAARLGTLKRPTFDEHRWRHDWENTIDDVFVERHGAGASIFRHPIAAGDVDAATASRPLRGRIIIIIQTLGGAPGV